MPIQIRRGVTFYRLVYEHVDHPGDRSYTAWLQDRHELHALILLHSDWSTHRLIYILRCRLKETADAR